MQRTQISLTEQERELLDREMARTGRSMSSLIREAIREKWGGEYSPADAVAAIDAAFGTWKREPGFDGAGYVEELRSGRRMDDVR